MTILEQILAGLQTKFTGVDTAILTRIATKKAEGITDETKVNSIVEGISFSDVLNSYGDFRAGDASKTAVSNYEKKHNLKDGKPIETTTTTKDTGEKLECALDELEAKIAELMETIQKDMLEKARKHRESHTYVAKNMEEMGNILNNTPGFVKAMWCGCQECEDKIKEQFAATSRCMPFEQETLSDTCVCCGKPAKKMVYWGKAY